jgi:hypothetical protein
MLIHRDRASGTLAVIKLSCCVLLTLCGDPCLAFFFVSWAHSPAVLRNLGPREKPSPPPENMLDGRNKYSRYSENGSRVDGTWIKHARIQSIQNRRLGMTFNHLRKLSISLGHKQLFERCTFQSSGLTLTILRSTRRTHLLRLHSPFLEMFGPSSQLFGGARVALVLESEVSRS